MKLILGVLLTAGFALPAGEPAGFQLWKSAELKGFARTLAPKVDATKAAVQQLNGFGNYSFLAVFRSGPGLAEYHETQADIMVIESGEATLVYGGKIVDDKTTAPNEIRGSAISGGMEKKLATGDIATVPAKMPHQVKLDPGKEVSYFVVKVTQ